VDKIEKIDSSEVFEPTKITNIFGVPYFRSNKDRVVRFLKDESYKIISEDTKKSRSIFSKEENIEFYKRHKDLSIKIAVLENEVFYDIPYFLNNNRPYKISNKGRIINHNEYGDEILLKISKDLKGKKLYVGMVNAITKKKHTISYPKLLAFTFLRNIDPINPISEEDFKLLDKNSKYSVIHKDGNIENNSLDNLKIVGEYEKFHKEKLIEKQKFLKDISDESEDIFFINRISHNGLPYRGKAIYNKKNHRMTILKDSKINTANYTYNKIYGKDYRHELVNKNGIVLIDVEFENPSIAGAFITGNNSNGLIDWKNKDDITLAEYYSLRRKTDNKDNS
jgi:hypothetical protein